MTYKPEIDGLRTIAVFLVLFCHFQLNLSGGYIGVDVFFVISGFLITTIVIQGVEKQRFSFLRFYGNRFVRLYPALIAVVVVTFIVGLLICDPKYLQNLARTGRYALMSLSNIYYKDHQGYFDFGAEHQPFLHTWSLGVEWQFYLLWPLIIWGLFKLFKTRWAIVAVLLVIILSSVIAGQKTAISDPQVAYYLMPYRAFELGIGGLLVFAYNRKLNPQASAALMFGGIALIIYGAFVFDMNTPFPGYPALVPCLGAAACIYGGQGFARGNFLRWPVMVYLGKISYSLYLIHWPLVKLYQYYIYRDLYLIEKLMLLVVTVLLGALLYTFVENKIRWKNMQHKFRGCIIIMGVAIFGIIPMVYTKADWHGLEWRSAYPELGEDQYVDWGGNNYPLSGILGNPNGEKIALLTGDSLAGSLLYGLDHNLKNTPQAIVQITQPGCTISEIDESERVSSQCRARAPQVIEAVNEQNLPLVLLQAWGTPVMLADRGIRFNISKYTTQESYLNFVEKNLNDLHTKIKNRPLILVGSYPYRYWGNNEKECLRRPAMALNACSKEFPSFNYKEIPVYTYNMFLMNYAKTHENVYYIDPAKAMCPNGFCETMKNAKLYNDGFHLSTYGSSIVAAYIVQKINEIIDTPQVKTVLSQTSHSN